MKWAYSYNCGVQLGKIRRQKKSMSLLINLVMIYESSPICSFTRNIFVFCKYFKAKFTNPYQPHLPFWPATGINMEFIHSI